MTKRLMIGLLAGGLLAAMVPGVAAADDAMGPPEATYGRDCASQGIKVGFYGKRLRPGTILADGSVAQFNGQGFTAVVVTCSAPE